VRALLKMNMLVDIVVLVVSEVVLGTFAVHIVVVDIVDITQILVVVVVVA